MGEWCTDQHGRSGLTQACLTSPHSREEVVRLVQRYVEKWVPEPGSGVLAGNSVHADAR
jgi:oligoribonuclease